MSALPPCFCLLCIANSTNTFQNTQRSHRARHAGAARGARTLSLLLAPDWPSAVTYQNPRCPFVLLLWPPRKRRCIDNATSCSLKQNFRLCHTARLDKTDCYHQCPPNLTLSPPTLPHLTTLPAPQHPTLPCKQALQWNCSARALGALVYFLQQVSTKTKQKPSPVYF